MGLASWLGFRAPRTLPTSETVVAPVLERLAEQTLGMSPDVLWRDQPHLRTVVNFLARNIAQLGVQAFELKGDGGRERVRDGVLPTLLRRPNPQQTGYELWLGLVGDLALYDDAYLLVTSVDGGYELRTIRPTWVTGVLGETAYSVDAYVVNFPEAIHPVEIPADNVVHFHGWHPLDERMGMSPIVALRSTLSEQIQSQRFREQVWRRGGRVGSYVSRPKDATAWSAEARQRFAEQWRNSYSNDGKAAGSTPVLEDGMEIKRVGFSAKEEEYIEGTKLSLATVAAVYHVNPTMVGILDNANYSNVREFRRMLYGETLGPIISQIEGRLNAFLLPLVGYDDPSTYVEFNTEARLRGSFEEQAAVMQSSIGGPWMTINEGRARQNLPAIDGGDELIRPLNLTQNGDQEPIPADEPDDPPAGDDASTEEDEQP